MDDQLHDRPREADTVADMDSDPGDARKLSTVGRYVVLDSVGMGGMGLVCAAYDPKLNRKIALKLLRNASNDEASTAGRNRLFREAQALAKLSHPNVVTVHDVDVFEGQVYIAMEFVEGTTLREWLRDEVRSWEQILDKFIMAGRGLAAAHQADIIHRDFKPSNVLISKEGDVRVADFGVAKERDRGTRADAQRDYLDFERKRRTVASGGSLDTTAEDALIEEIQSNVSLELTVAGRMVGTPAYMAPEQHMGLRVGPYTDQYSFCVSLYEALYGRLPFEGADRRDQLSKMTEGRLPPPPKDAARNVPSWLHKVVGRGLRPHPSERWPSMDELLAALERDPAKRLRRWALAGVGVLGIVAGIVGVSVALKDPPPPQNPCVALGDEVERHWNSKRQAEIEAAFARSTKPFAGDAARRVIATLDRWAKVWRLSKVAVCEATRSGAQSGELLDMRMYCLDQRAREVNAIVDVFAEADDEIVERSVSAAHALGDPDACQTVLETTEFKQRKLDPFVLEQIETMDADLDRARALASLHMYDESLPLQARVAAKARELSHPWMRMRALLELAKSQLETGDVVGGEAGLREVVRLASELHDVSQEADAWIQLIFYVAAEHNRIAEGQAWSFAAEMALVRMPSERADLQVQYENALANLALADGDRQGGIEHFAKALELARKAYGEDHPLTIKMLMNNAVPLAKAKKYKQAEKVLLEAVTRSKEVYGPAHPVLATAYYNLGNLYVLSKQFSQAENALRSALSIYERIGGPTDRILAKPLFTRGKVSREQRRFEEALADFERAAAIFVQSGAEQSSEVAAVFQEIGTTQAELRRFDDARLSFDRAQAIYNHIYPNGHRHVGGLMKRRCSMFVEARLFADAVAACDLALENADRFGLEDMSIKKEIYQLLVTAERGRGRTAAAERAQDELDQIIAAIQAKGKDAENDDDDG